MTVRAGAGQSPSIHCLLSLPRREKANSPRSEQGKRGRDDLPPSFPHSPGVFGGGQDSPRSEAAPPQPWCRSGTGQRAGRDSRPEPGTSFEVLPHSFHNIPHGVKAPSCLPAWSWQDKNPDEVGWGSDAQRTKGKAPGLRLPKMSPFWRAYSRGFQLSQCQGWEQTWGAPRQGGLGWGRYHLCAWGPEARGERPGAGALRTFTAAGKQKPVYFAPVIPLPTNLFGY